MDFATILGLVMAWSLMVWAVLMGGSLLLFIDVPSVVIVFGGTFSTLFIRFTMSEVWSTVSVTLRAFMPNRRNTVEIIKQMTDLANIARKDGILALEKIRTTDTFLQSAINHCVDGADPEFLEAVLIKDMENMAERHGKGIAILEHMAEFAPAMGMIGTLIGLVQMLANMSDPSAIGPGMAVAILTTLYGAWIANLICTPIARKLGDYSKEEQTNRQIIIDGMIGIQKGVNPRMLQESLKAFLPPHIRESVSV